MKKIAVFAFLLLLSTSSYSQVQELAYYWWGNKAQFNTASMQNVCLSWNGSSCSNWASWLNDISNAGTDYVANTDMEGGLGPNGEGQIIWVNSYWPNIDLTGAAATVWQGQQCVTWINNQPVVNSNCNKTNQRPTLAYLYLNNKFFDNRYEQYAQYYWTHYSYRVAIHELGHVIGMDHNNNPVLNSFMQDPMHEMTSTTLHSQEITWINSIL